jgi:hypothetical protein
MIQREFGLGVHWNTTEYLPTERLQFVCHPHGTQDIFVLNIAALRLIFGSRRAAQQSKIELIGMVLFFLPWRVCLRGLVS